MGQNAERLGVPAILRGDSVSDTVIVSLVALLGTLSGTFGGILTSSKLTNFRLEQLEKKVEKHNGVIERTYDLEKGEELLEERFRDLERRIGSLEAGAAR